MLDLLLHCSANHAQRAGTESCTSSTHPSTQYCTQRVGIIATNALTMRCKCLLPQLWSHCVRVWVGLRVLLPQQ